MSLGFFAKFVTNVTGDNNSTSASSHALIVMLIVSPTCDEIFMMLVSFAFKINSLSEFSCTNTLSLMWGA